MEKHVHGASMPEIADLPLSSPQIGDGFLVRRGVSPALVTLPDFSSGVTPHSHAIADVTGLQASLDGKQPAGSYANTTHSHTISDTTGLQAALDSKAPALGVDDNYVTDAEKTKLSNLSGTNTGDQDLSGLATITYVDNQDDLEAPHLHFILYSTHGICKERYMGIQKMLRDRCGRSQFYKMTTMKTNDYYRYIQKDSQRLYDTLGISHYFEMNLEKEWQTLVWDEDIFLEYMDDEF